MLILGIETSCDETSAAVIEGEDKSQKVNLLSNVIASSLPLHSKTGGIIPENAAREQIKYIIPVIKKAIEQCNNLTIQDIDAIAVTYGPGLIGSLLIGVETAKTLSYIFNKPLIPVNHLLGHIYANFIDLSSWRSPQATDRISTNKDSIASFTLSEIEGLRNDILFPAIGLIVSGGHTDLILLRGHNRLRWLGGTRDDAAGEALDKIGRLLGLPYPGGPYIEKAARNGNQNKYKFPSPLINSNDFDFSFSGLKTAVLREVQAIEQPASPAGGLNNEIIADISASVQKAIIDVLISKTIRAAKQYNAKSILIGGGVAVNQTLRNELQSSIELFVPAKNLCTDNGAMIAAAAFFSINDRSASYGGNKIGVDWTTVDANPGLYF